jgi:hypothetical protein
LPNGHSRFAPEGDSQGIPALARPIPRSEMDQRDLFSLGFRFECAVELNHSIEHVLDRRGVELFRLLLFVGCRFLVRFHRHVVLKPYDEIFAVRRDDELRLLPISSEFTMRSMIAPRCAVHNALTGNSDGAEERNYGDVPITAKASAIAKITFDVFGA